MTYLFLLKWLMDMLLFSTFCAEQSFQNDSFQELSM